MIRRSLGRSIVLWCFCPILQLTSSSSTNLKFPANFKFGAATSAYQIEGGWNADGKGESTWDRFVHEHSADIQGGATGDVAADSYHRWREDVRIAADMGLQFYRFSINWPRILPTGFTNKINTAGVKYYSDLIDALLAANIEPVVTLYHWEMPVKIRDLGGWTNPLMVKWFGDYARVVFSLYADRVKTWITINEAISICDYAFTKGHFAPKIKEPELAPFLCNKHLLLAHATAYRIFENEFRDKYPGRISLANYELWIRPATANDTELAELGRQHSTGRYSHPIFSQLGGWPPAIEKLMLEYSLKQGYGSSRLPPFTKEEVEFVKVSFQIVPEGIREQLSWIKKEYGDIDILITENGFSTEGRQLNDLDRTQYFKDYLEQVLLSIKVDNVSVVGYAAWSLIDNFEWLDGYKTKFGLYEVDFSDPNRTRTPRTSAHYLTCVIRNRSLDVPDHCYRDKYLKDLALLTSGQNCVFVQQSLLLFNFIVVTVSLDFMR